jgi:hypothetical protein
LQQLRPRALGPILRHPGQAVRGTQPVPIKQVIASVGILQPHQRALGMGAKVAFVAMDHH